jgi:hypothetical protein
MPQTSALPAAGDDSETGKGVRNPIKKIVIGP